MQNKTDASQYRDKSPQEIEEILKSRQRKDPMEEDNIHEFVAYRNKIKEYKKAKENLLKKGYPEIKSYAYI